LNSLISSAKNISTDYFLMPDFKSISEENEENIDQELADEDLKSVSAGFFTYKRGKSLDSEKAFPWGNPFLYVRKKAWSWFSSWW